VLFASNDNKTSFEQRKKWPLNRQLRRFFEDKYLTSAVNFPTSAVKFCHLHYRNLQYLTGTFSTLQGPSVPYRYLQYLTGTFSTLQGPSVPSVPYRYHQYLTGTFSTLQGPSVPYRDLQYLTETFSTFQGP
jgi:hypothetical protein